MKVRILLTIPLLLSFVAGYYVADIHKFVFHSQSEHHAGYHEISHTAHIHESCPAHRLQGEHTASLLIEEKAFSIIYKKRNLVFTNFTITTLQHHTCARPRAPPFLS